MVNALHSGTKGRVPPYGTSSCITIVMRDVSNQHPRNGADVVSDRLSEDSEARYGVVDRQALLGRAHPVHDVSLGFVSRSIDSDSIWRPR